MTEIATNLRTNAEVVLRSNLPICKKRAILLRLSRQVELLNAPPAPDGAGSAFSLYDEEKEALRTLSQEMADTLSRLGGSVS